MISSAGRRGQLLTCFRESARELGVEARLVAADLRPELSAACQMADVSVAVPRCGSPDFVPALLEACKRHGVRLVVPTIDTELHVLSEHRAMFAAAGVDVAVSAPSLVAVARDKQATAALFAEVGLNTPRTLAAAEYSRRPAALNWPVILKLRGGSSSIGIVRPRSVAEATQTALTNEELIVQELWEGREYTVNMFFDLAGKLRCAVPHWRIETRAGEVSKGRTEDIPALRDAAWQLGARMTGARGALCFQAIVNDAGEYAAFEINARFGGGYPLAHRAGARFTTWLLEETLGRPSTASDTWKAGVTMLRYDNAVFCGD